VSSPNRPGTQPPGSAPYDAAQAAGLGDVAWADDDASSGPAATNGPTDPGPGGREAAPGSVGPEPTLGEDTAGAKSEMTVEDLVRDLERVSTERDQYLDASRRLQAEFENYRKRMTREQAEAISRGSQALATELLPVLDGCEAAVQQGQAEVEPIRNQLIELLAKAGLERTGDPGDPFDPELHDAVMHEPADDEQDGSVIAEVLRTGYSWKGRVLRPAMVKVRG
jgi:molecular chaperone GrpE